VASLTKKIIGGRPYYYLRECQRINGKPTIVRQQYLGPAEQLVRQLADPAPEKAVIREFGASAACLDLAQQLDLAATIDRHVPKQGARGPTVGQYLLVAVLNRCIAPRSKARIGAWYETTVLPRLVRLRTSQLTSQRFWDNMDRLDEETIGRIEDDLSAAAVARFRLDLRCLLFDATSFFTFIDSFNKRTKLPQRGHSKQGRANLRLLGLALLVTADGDVPLFHHTYAGNQHDAKTFGAVAGALARRCRELSQGAADITLIFDKGNNSKVNLKAVAQGPFHFVGSLVPTQHPELLAIERSQMRRLDKSQLEVCGVFKVLPDRARILDGRDYSPRGRESPGYGISGVVVRLHVQRDWCREPAAAPAHGIGFAARGVAPSAASSSKSPIARSNRRPSVHRWQLPRAPATVGAQRKGPSPSKRPASRPCQRPSMPTRATRCNPDWCR
jgi:hypothetical protein